MTFIVCSIIGIVLDVFSFSSSLSWMAFPGFALGLASWVWAVQMRYAYPGVPKRASTLVLGIIAALGGFAGIFLSFTLGSLLYGGIMVF